MYPESGCRGSSTSGTITKCLDAATLPVYITQYINADCTGSNFVTSFQASTFNNSVFMLKGGVACQNMTRAESPFPIYGKLSTELSNLIGSASTTPTPHHANEGMHQNYNTVAAMMFSVMCKNKRNYHLL